MNDSEQVAQWGEQWLNAWCIDPTAREDERDARLWDANNWRTATLETVIMGWWHEERRLWNGKTTQEHNAGVRANDELKLYLGTRHGLPIWRAFMAYRSKGLPVPENILAKFDQWALRLQTLQQQAVSGELPRNEGDLILQALELAGDRKKHQGLKLLGELERRRRVATKIARLHERGVTWSQIAARMGLGLQAAKEVFYEFAPGPRRKRKRAAVGEGLAEAHRRMIAK